MLHFTATPRMLNVARRVVWFQDPHDTLKNPYQFMAYVMRYGTVEDVIAVREVTGMEGFEEALRHAPPGIIDKRSWAYWNLVCHIQPSLPLPVRSERFTG